MNELLYEGKAKKIFVTEQNNVLRMEFKDSLTAFNAQKKGQFLGKGSLNCQISTLLFKLLNLHHIKNHWLETTQSNEMKVQKTEIIPLEVVVRNYLAGSLAKKLGKTEGDSLPRPIIEFYYKQDSLNDPFVNEDQILAMGWATASQIEVMKLEALKINQVLLTSFQKIGLKLVDFKVEFGLNAEKQLILSDEISPDCMRLWDSVTDKKLDKDRFRQDLGSVDEAYAEVLKRLNEGKLV